ncbi:50S ribosomal protein L4 [Psychroflexus halocasei]|uniref:Large ribosomal subunit protein uL4 n=1 Tax=Psychroflexus halocasei TaxID=908615 RepID=A0A1H3VIZ3_9FLAO|nr:50S ribosomal protein L4 [Psychroflexus halocasei]SDZ74214.1 large subunit ribosomal protein L4 [Psychroflexus halocasei]
MKVAVLDINGQKTGREIDILDSVFAIEPNDHAIYLDVKQHLANKRQGTHKAKERAEIKGSTRKIKKQKGTGTARAGSIKSPIFRGGGRVFGPRVRDYSQKLNKKVKRLARRSALSQKMAADHLFVIEDFSFDAPKTKDFIKVLEAFKATDKKSTFVLNAENKNVYLSARNLERSNVVSHSELNTYAVMNSNVLYIAESQIESLQEILGK